MQIFPETAIVTVPSTLAADLIGAAEKSPQRRRRITTMLTGNGARETRSAPAVVTASIGSSRRSDTPGNTAVFGAGARPRV